MKAFRGAFCLTIATLVLIALARGSPGAAVILVLIGVFLSSFLRT